MTLLVVYPYLHYVNKKKNSLDYFIDNGTMNRLNVFTLTNRADPGERVNWVSFFDL